MTQEQAEGIQRSLGRIEGKLDGFDHRVSSLETLDDRVDALEGWQKWMLGAQAMLGAVFMFAVKMVSK